MRQMRGGIDDPKQLATALNKDFSLTSSTSHWKVNDLQAHPLAIWVELNLGLEREAVIE